MRGDRLLVKDHHVRAAQGIADLILPQVGSRTTPLVVTIAGESGSGKSEIAQALCDRLRASGTECLILQQDDYFVYPPRTNEKMRREDISHVGISEVHLDLLDRNLGSILGGESTIQKPLVIFDEDRVVTESISVEGIDVVAVEGTYTTLLRHAHCRVFIDRTWNETKESRRERGRERQDAFLEHVLSIEHEIISSHRPLADIIVTSGYEVEPRIEDA